MIAKQGRQSPIPSQSYLCAWTLRPAARTHKPEASVLIQEAQGAQANRGSPPGFTPPYSQRPDLLPPQSIGLDRSG